MSEQKVMSKQRTMSKEGEETVQGKVKWVSGEEADQVSLVHTQCC